MALREIGEVLPAEELDRTSGLELSFFQKRKKGKVRVVAPPSLAFSVADTHAHIEMLAHPAENLARAAFWGVRFVCAMVDPSEDAHTTYDKVSLWQEEAKKLLCAEGLSEYSNKVPYIRVGVGCHPHNAKYYSDNLEQTLIAALKNPLTCALGEVGLDYHYDFSPREVQRKVFRRQIQLAHEAGVPLILHLREAHDEAFQILREEGFPCAGVLLHCFNLDETVLAPWLSAGCYVAFGGPLTFNASDDVRASALQVPLDHLLTETDSPYMTPEPMRGMECGPEHTIFTAQRMVEVFHQAGVLADGEEEAFLTRLYNNALELLDRPPTLWQCS